MNYEKRAKIFIKNSFPEGILNEDSRSKRRRCSPVNYDAPMKSCELPNSFYLSRGKETRRAFREYLKRFGE